MSDLTLETIMNNTPKVFQAEKAGDTNAVVQFDFSGDESSKWVLAVKDGACTVEKGTTENPDMTMFVDSDVYKDIVTGKTNAMKAFMSGKIRVKGDMNLAMKFPQWFKMAG